ncbi:MAG: hypothetical protein AAGH76_17375 [Pseudomonadota bacterium]
MTESRADIEFAQALAAVEAETTNPIDQVDMLVEIAMGLQQQPKSPAQLHNAVALYDKALEKCPEHDLLLAARIQARRATALQAIPETGSECLLQAQAGLETALVTLTEHGKPEEVAEVNMNLGLVLQSLAGMQQAKLTDAISAYQRAARFFNREEYATEYAILHNNLATAYLSIPMTDDRAKMREALAVQCFEDALRVVTLIDNPTEYAMLQNNLGNALQYVSSGHAVENNLRALDAYDEALKVRGKRETPLEYANTISNKANCLRNLPDNLEQPEAGNAANLKDAHGLYVEARNLFRQYGETTKATMLDEILEEIAADRGDGIATAHEHDATFGEARVK